MYAVLEFMMQSVKVDAGIIRVKELMAHPTAASFDEPLTLNLDNIEKAEYEKFIQSLIEKFPECYIKKDPERVDDDKCFDEELGRKINNCFKPTFRHYTDARECGDSARRTFKGEELKNENWLFQLRLKHGDRDLEILIKKNNLYLVGYKGNYKQENGTVSAENCWIVLDGKNHLQVAESVSNFLTPKSELYENLIKKLGGFKGLAKREEHRKINYATKKLKKIKSNIESHYKKYENPEETEDYKRVNSLLKMVTEDITRECLEEELEGDDKAARDFLNHVKKPQEDHILLGKLIEKLKKEYENNNQQGQAPNEAEASENQRNQRSIILWGKVFNKIVVILGSLTAEKKDTIVWGKRTKGYTVEDWREEHEALIKLKRMLKNKFNIDDGTQETNPTDDGIQEVFLSEKATLKGRYKAVNTEDKAKVVKFHKELKEMSDVFKLMMKRVRADAEIKDVKDRLATVNLNREAFTEAVEHLTTEDSFGENESDTAEHIIKLAIMICEAARFPDIKKHVAKNYHETTHEVTTFLSEECITSIYSWSHRSALMQRGGVYARETILLGDDPAVIRDMDEKEYEC
ncbi:hypothetical protein DCAR_0933405 [Daucus carota subsp. sativus]|uniref:rRNA N-glycosylase n=1 Tax=Daucus carota subsp. sativus TaxID=79200 RepID=A0A175YDC1_DAUCS|nr:hypothetical protein DCAR_0933405 [Daucus carota subsp. sativus]